MGSTVGQMVCFWEPWGELMLMMQVLGVFRVCYGKFGRTDGWTGQLMDGWTEGPVGCMDCASQRVSRVHVGALQVEVQPVSVYERNFALALASK